MKIIKHCFWKYDKKKPSKRKKIFPIVLLKSFLKYNTYVYNKMLYPYENNINNEIDWYFYIKYNNL